jgi:hypothetical protein
VNSEASYQFQGVKVASAGHFPYVRTLRPVKLLQKHYIQRIDQWSISWQFRARDPWQVRRGARWCDGPGRVFFVAYLLQGKNPCSGHGGDSETLMWLLRRFYWRFKLFSEVRSGNRGGGLSQGRPCQGKSPFSVLVEILIWRVYRCDGGFFCSASCLDK